jgi:hypothetical protein
VKAARILIVAAAIVLTLRRYFRRRPHAGLDAGEVCYHVPNGQDPAAVLAAVRLQGLSARPEVVAGEPVVVVSLDTPGDRDRVREIVRQAPENMEGDPRSTGIVTFSDEV